MNIDSIKLVKVCLGYRPPRPIGSPIDNGNSEKFIEALSTLNGNKLFLGDYNLPNISWRDNYSPNKGERMFLDFFSDNYLEQKVKCSTHRQGNTLDIVLSNDE